MSCLFILVLGFVFVHKRAGSSAQSSESDTKQKPVGCAELVCFVPRPRVVIGGPRRGPVSLIKAQSLLQHLACNSISAVPFSVVVIFWLMGPHLLFLFVCVFVFAHKRAGCIAQSSESDAKQKPVDRGLLVCFVPGACVALGRCRILPFNGLSRATLTTTPWFIAGLPLGRGTRRCIFVDPQNTWSLS